MMRWKLKLDVYFRTNCICGDKPPHLPFLDDPLKCELNECPGDTTEKCGALYRLKMYHTKHAGM